MLVCRDYIGVLRGGVEEGKEFAHDGGEGDFGGFGFLQEALVEGFEDGVVGDGGDGGEGGHVESAAERGASAGDVALAAERAAIVVEWGQAGELADLSTA